MALTSTGRKIEHNKVVVETQTYESDGVIHETLTFKDIDLQILRESRVEIGKRTANKWTRKCDGGP